MIRRCLGLTVAIFVLQACLFAGGPDKPDTPKPLPVEIPKTLFQSQGIPSNIFVSTDSNGYLIVSGIGAGTGVQSQRLFANTFLSTDSNGYLLVNCASGCGSGLNYFSSIPVSGQTTVAASGSTALTFVASTGMTITTNNTTKTVTFASSGGGSGCTTSGSATQVITDDGAGGCTSNAGFKYTTGVATLGTAGSLVGKVSFANATSGTVTLAPTTGALGSAVLTLPTATDTLIGKATTDTLTHKTYDTAGTGNAFAINGTSITDVSGTGAVCLASGSACGGSATPPTYLAKTADYTLVASTDFATIGTVELTSGAHTFTLPTAVGVTGQTVILKNLQTANALTINTTSAQTIDGAASGAITISNNCLAVQSNNANWKVVGACGYPLSSVGTATDTLHGGVSPAYGPVVLTTDVSGILPIANGGTGSATSFNRTTLIVGNCQGGSTASVSANTQASGAATAGCTGTTITEGTASFADATTNELQYHFTIPDNWDGAAMTLSGYWRTSATSNSVTWQVSGKCGGDAVVLPTTYSSTPDTVADTAKGTTLQRNAFSITLSVAANHSLATCSAGDEVYLRFFRDSSDSLGAAAVLLDSMVIKGGKNGGL